MHIATNVTFIRRQWQLVNLNIRVIYVYMRLCDFVIV